MLFHLFASFLMFMSFLSVGSSGPVYRTSTPPKQVVPSGLSKQELQRLHNPNTPEYVKQQLLKRSFGQNQELNNPPSER